MGRNSSRAQHDVGMPGTIVQTAPMNASAADPAENELTQLIESLFPPGVAVSFSMACPHDADLLPEELTQTHGMVNARLTEFRHGRYCARQAMDQLGHPAAPVRKRQDRSPEWPAGLAGSITHTGKYAAAALASSADYISLGLDVEQAGELDPDELRLIVRPDESVGGDGALGQVLFSIKECIYKCIHPIVHTYVDFQEMQVDLSGTPGTFRAIPHSKNFDAAIIAGLQGRYCLAKGLIISASWIMPTY